MQTTPQSVIDSLVDCLMLSAEPSVTSIKTEVRVTSGRNLQPIVQIKLRDAEWTLLAATAGDAAVELVQAGVILRKGALIDVGRRLGRAALAAFAQAAEAELERR